MNHASDRRLAGAAFAPDEHGRVQHGDLIDGFQQFFAKIGFRFYRLGWRLW